MVMQKILITGSDGFIGKHLIDRINKDYNIYCLKSDLRNHNEVKLEVAQACPDLVIHLAARTEVEHSFYEQTTFCDINYTGTVNLIESLVATCTRPRILFASTMEVYGWQPVSDKIKQGCCPAPLPVFDPDHTALNPNAPYAVAKVACEKYLEYAHRCFGLDYVNVRQTNCYGRRDNSFFVTEQIISQMIKDPNRCKLGYKTPYRNFIFIDDLIDAWVTLIDKFEQVANNNFTVGPNNPIQIQDYAQLIAKKLNWQGTIEWDSKPARPGEIYLLNSSEEKIHSYTGWYPKITLDQGLDRTIEIWKNKSL
jgi:GDP-4-dehydro-6-deoxy-D-mannose reductase